ncbi:hypothetical protein V1279_003131 [Bradyrhizobium sp. AZCC 1610]|uniref:GTA-gp10 family protein n=1 Tax=Bradyrhizobium sp. AZCC 1610 TaxID=3117020 RepID=UPI002FF0FF99
MTDTTDTPRPIIWAGGSHHMTLNQRWVRSVLSVRGLPGDFGSTPAAAFKRFEQGVASTDDIEQVIYLGLIGGGLSREEADDLVDKHVRARPVLENLATAVRVLSTLFADQEGEAA